MPETTGSTLIGPSLNQAGLTLALLMPLSILPAELHTAPPVLSQTSTISYGYESNDRKFRFISEINASENHLMILEKFASTLVKETVDADIEISQITRKLFFDMYEDF